MELTASIVLLDGDRSLDGGSRFAARTDTEFIAELGARLRLGGNLQMTDILVFTRLKGQSLRLMTTV
jgi:hypothetical protein